MFTFKPSPNIDNEMSAPKLAWIEMPRVPESEIELLDFFCFWKGGKYLCVKYLQNDPSRIFVEILCIVKCSGMEKIFF
jgi:hypothetical protein